MRSPLFLAATALLAISAAPAVQAQKSGSTPAKTQTPAKAAPAKAAPAAKPAADKAPAAAPAAADLQNEPDVRRAVKIMQSFSAAFQSDKVQNPVKGRLLMCLYNNKLSVISEAAGRVIANNSAMKDDNATDVYRAAATVCGISFQPAGAATDPKAKAPATPAPKRNTGEGR